MINAELILLLEEYENINAINHLISYFYRLKKPKRNHLPICAYGTFRFPPTYESLTEDFQMVRRMQKLRIPRTLWHFVVSFDLPSGGKDTFYFCHQLADRIAKLFSTAYPVCYVYHEDTGHPHVHFAVLTASYRPGHPPLEEEILSGYISQMQALAYKDFHTTIMVVEKESRAKIVQRGS